MKNFKCKDKTKQMDKFGKQNVVHKQLQIQCTIKAGLNAPNIYI